VRPDISGLRLSATDLSHFLSCRHLTALDLAVAHRTREKPYKPDDPLLQLLFDRGIAHEKAYVETLRREGRDVLDLNGIPRNQPDEAIAQTMTAIHAGADVTEQALKQEIETLEKKDELTAAEEKRLEDLRTKLEEQEEKNDRESGDNNAQTLDDMARRIESVPEMGKAIRSAGLTPREYSLISLVTMQSMMVHGFQKAAGGKELPKEVAGTVLEDNIKFVAANEAEIMRLLEKLKASEKKP